MSIHRFAQLREAVRQTVEQRGLSTTTLGTNEMRQCVREVVDDLISKFRKKFTSTDEGFIRDALSRLLHLEKANIVRHVGAKRDRDPIYKRKRLKTDDRSNLRIKPSSKSIPIASPARDTPPTLNTTARTSTDLYLKVCQEGSREDPVMLSLACLLSDPFEEQKATNMFHQASYKSLCSSLREEGIMDEFTSFKLWGWVQDGPSQGWWRIQASPSLQSCLLAQMNFNGDDFYYVITQGMN